MKDAASFGISFTSGLSRDSSTIYRDAEGWSIRDAIEEILRE